MRLSVKEKKEVKYTPNGVNVKDENDFYVRGKKDKILSAYELSITLNGIRFGFIFFRVLRVSAYCHFFHSLSRATLLKQFL